MVDRCGAFAPLVDDLGCVFAVEPLDDFGTALCFGADAGALTFGAELADEPDDLLELEEDEPPKLPPPNADAGMARATKLAMMTERRMSAVLDSVVESFTLRELVLDREMVDLSVILQAFQIASQLLISIRLDRNNPEIVTISKIIISWLDRQ